ncbi:MAG TPA: RodZ domain-containing protein [Sphingomicrobium sp.]|nr:RodZ domain-containing protein [Sphingomicrobium sp.]
MAKREPDPEPLPEEQIEPELAPVGERLRAAREQKGLSLEDVAAQTRIPRRHLESIENAEWDSLPAPTYTIGFAKSYASAVGLDRAEIGDQLREEMGGQRFASTSADVFEPADPRRTMPKGLVIGAIIAVVLLVVVMSWLNKRSLETPESGSGSGAAQIAAPVVAAPAAPITRVAPAKPATPQGPVVLTATDAVWLQVSQKGGPTLYSGTLQPNQSYTVPATATAPVLKTGKPEALKITVGNETAPAVGPAATTVSNVSLLPADLMKVPAAAGTATFKPSSGPVPATQPGTAPANVAQ